MALVQHVRHNTPRRLTRRTVDVVVGPQSEHLRLVQRRQRRARWMVFVGVTLFTLMLGAAWFQTQLARRQIQLDELNRHVRIESERYDSLRLERGTLLSPATLMASATSSGMQPPTIDDYLTLDAATLAYVEQFAPQPRPGAAAEPIDELAQIGVVKAAVGNGP